MFRQGVKEGFHVEWINITYRSVGATLLALAAIVGGGGGYWYYTKQILPKNDANGAIDQASKRLTEASVLPVDERLGQLVENAKVQLRLARDEFDDRDYGKAAVSALSSEQLSIKVIAAVGGDKSESRQVRFSKIEGDVRVKQAGGFSWATADKKMTLRVGDQVKTSTGASAELIYFDGTVTRIRPGSLLEIQDLYEDPVTKVRRVREKLTWGEIQASTQKRNVSGSFHEVSTMKIAARSEDKGKYRITFDEKKKTSVVDVFDGTLELSAAGKKETVSSGERVRASADGRLSAKELLPGVPRLIVPSDQRVFIFENPLVEKFTLSWEALKGTPRYRLAISDRPLFANLLYDAKREGASAVLDGVPPGSYHWKVAAVSESGVEGPFSEVRSFRISTRRIRDRTDSEPPELRVTEFVPIGQMVIINGETEPGATLWVDANKVDVYDDGSFNAVVRLRREGLNELLLVAQDTAGNKTTVKRTAYVETY